MSDFSNLKQLEIARIATNAQIVTPSQPISQMHQRWKQHSITDANAASNVAEQPVAVVPYPAVFVTGNVVVPANIANSTSVYAVVSLNKRTAGGAAVLVASANSGNVAVQAWTVGPTTGMPLVPVANAANVQLAQGDVLTVSVTKTSTGAYLANGATAEMDFLIEDIA